MSLAVALSSEAHVRPSAPSAAGELPLGGATVHPDMTNAELMELFEGQPALNGAVVVVDGQPIGLINRARFFTSFARPYFRELFLRKPCTVFMDPAPLVVDAGASVPEVGASVSASGTKGLNEGFVVTQAGKYYGLCDGLTLLRALAELQEEQHRQLLSSIDYASTIQQALLVDSRAALARTFGDDHVLIWEPRDIVGGDCFFAREDEAGALFGLIDCTGHGVPGALLTSIAISETSRLAADPALRADPAALLGGLNQRVKAALQQSDRTADGADDGMDAVFLWLDAARTRARMASARLPVFLAGPDGAVTTLKGDRKGIGYRETPADFCWTGQEFDITPGLRVFLATDGVGDQLGEEKPMAFGWNRFRQALTGAAGGSVGDQAQAAWGAFLAWQGRQARRDDVSILGADLGASAKA
jgi:serine phosphatase RsbU (regulator of sigma subunit)